VELCREVIDRLDAGSPDVEIREKEAQLRAISKAIEQLEKTGIPVPETLRGEKTRLAADLGIKADAAQALNHLADEFEEILKDLKTRLGRGLSTSAPKKPMAKRSYTPKTDRLVLREHIILALRSFGGRALGTEVVKEVGRQLEDKFLPGDLEWYESSKEHAWEKKTHWERYRMVKDGLMRSDSIRGYWELNEPDR
jgi:hypothetical protein